MPRRAHLSITQRGQLFEYLERSRSVCDVTSSNENKKVVCCRTSSCQMPLLLTNCKVSKFVPVLN